MEQKFNNVFDNICEDYYEKILKYVYFNTKDKFITDDITQEVFLIIYDKISVLLQHPNLGGFIFQTAKNLIKQHQRKVYLKLLKEVQEDEKINNIPDSTYAISVMIDKEINEYDFVSDVIEQLSDEKKKLYNLYYINNKSMEQISKEIGVEYATLRMRYVRLRREIKQLIKKLAEEKF